MNNEEKILALLEQMRAETNARLDKLEAGQAKLEAGQAKLEAEVAVIKEDVRFTKDTAILMENNYGDQIKGMWDAYSAVRDKLNEHSTTLARIERKVENLEARVRFHDHRLESLRQN